MFSLKQKIKSIYKNASKGTESNKETYRAPNYTLQQLQQSVTFLQSNLSNFNNLFHKNQLYHYFITKQMLEELYVKIVGCNRFCNVCKKPVIVFYPMGNVNVRANARCPHCNSLERDRLTLLYLEKETDIFLTHKKLLHIAPEKGLNAIFKNCKNIDYLPVDIDTNNPLITEKMDIQNINYPDNYFDVIYCSHVLEHVPNDKLAIQNLYRVVKEGGYAILNSPVRHNIEKTLENSNYNTPELRLKYYGQADHVRYYGEDYMIRLETAGFTVKKISYVHELTLEEKNKFGLNEPAADEYIYFCVKQKKDKLGESK